MDRKKLLLALTVLMGISGAIMGWRGAFLVPVAVVALVWQWIALPAMKTDVRRSGKVFKLLKSRSVAYGLAGCGVLSMGQFALLT